MDLAGFAVGVVEKDRLLGPGGTNPPREGDALVGLHSERLRSNGYSLARAALLGRAGRRLDDEAWPGAGHSLADELLRPSLIYTPAVLALPPGLRRPRRGPHNRRRPTRQRAPSPARRPRRRPPSRALAGAPYLRRGPRRRRVSDDAEMYRTFNMGLGMVVAVPSDQAPAAVATLAGLGFGAGIVGEVTAGPGPLPARVVPS